ncbi:Expansin family protein [Mycena venus]|uniref:Expansin family protein n=1 Tax=Mycena venus TaxID=2733690 RepID=A0A8H6XWF7_9AGAR|nr:Expansin family protein [Mycena venus]
MLFYLSLLVLPAVYAYHRVPHYSRTKRASTGNNEFTFYDPGLGACGGTNSGNDFVVAMNIPEFNGGASCNKEITITYNGKTAKAQVVDECMHCGFGGLDLSRGLFNFFADESQGAIHGDWSYGDSLTQHTTTTTSSTTSQTSTSTSKATSTTTSSATTTPTTRSSTFVSSTSTSATSSAAIPKPSPQIMAQFSDALVNLVGLVVQGAEANAV